MNEWTEEILVLRPEGSPLQDLFGHPDCKRVVAYPRGDGEEPIILKVIDGKKEG